MKATNGVLVAAPSQLSLASIHSASYRQHAAITLHLPAALNVAGRAVRGHVEIDYPKSQEDNIQQVFIRLQGTLHTKCRVGENGDTFKWSTTELLSQSVSLFMQGRDYPSRNETVLRLPFVLDLPADAPPSFEFDTYMNVACIRYAVEVTGMRSGTFNVDRVLKLPIVVVAPDPIGATLRAELNMGWGSDWGRAATEMRMRKYPWGDHSNAKMELLVPHMSTFPLFTPIPYTINVTTWSASAKPKNGAQPKERLFPSVPTAPTELDFQLRRYVDLITPHTPSEPEEAVGEIIQKGLKPYPPVAVQISEYVWIDDEERDDGRGFWVQQATFRSHMIMRCTPTFLREEIKIRYYLSLKFTFPGLGNTLRLQLPLNIGSGVEAPQPFDENSRLPCILDLPPSYWDAEKWVFR